MRFCWRHQARHAFEQALGLDLLARAKRASVADERRDRPGKAGRWTRHVPPLLSHNFASRHQSGREIAMSAISSSVRCSRWPPRRHACARSPSPFPVLRHAFQIRPEERHVFAFAAK